MFLAASDQALLSVWRMLPGKSLLPTHILQTKVSHAPLTPRDMPFHNGVHQHGELGLLTTPIPHLPKFLAP